MTSTNNPNNTTTNPSTAAALPAPAQRGSAEYNTPALMRRLYTAFLRMLSRRLGEGKGIEHGNRVWIVCIDQMVLGRTLNQLGELEDQGLETMGVPRGWVEDWKKWIREFVDEGVVVG